MKGNPFQMPRLGAGAGGNLNPPPNCRCRNCGIGYGSGNAGRYGGGGIQDFRLTSEMGADIHDLIRSLCSFIEDVRVALGIEVHAVDVLGKSVVVNSPAGEPPVHRVNLDLPVRHDDSVISGKEHQDGHRFDVSDAVHRERNR